MNKSELVKEVSQISGVSSALVKIVLSQALVSIATHTAAGDSVMISGFGTFTGRQVRKYRIKSAEGRERSGESTKVNLTFQPSKTVWKITGIQK